MPRIKDREITRPSEETLAAMWQELTDRQAFLKTLAECNALQAVGNSAGKTGLYRFKSMWRLEDNSGVLSRVERPYMDMGSLGSVTPGYIGFLAISPTEGGGEWEIEVAFLSGEQMEVNEALSREEIVSSMAQDAVLIRRLEQISKPIDPNLIKIDYFVPKGAVRRGAFTRSRCYVYVVFPAGDLSASNAFIRFFKDFQIGRQTG